MSDPSQASIVHFGGPDQPRGALRDLLEARVDAVPSGGEIDWATYYLRDQALAKALVRARKRGVRVRVVVERRPRKASANKDVFRMLGEPEALGRALHRFAPPKWLGEREVKPHLHSKIYAFSHPQPSVFLGSFNPSGNGPDDDAKILASIGDQDAGHNLLVEHRDPRFVSALARHVRWLPWLAWPPAMRLLPGRQKPVEVGPVQAWFFPRRDPGVVAALLQEVGKGQRLRVAMSHVKNEQGLRMLCGAARRGAEVCVILHHTERRAPAETEATLREAGAEVLRYRHADALPMHAKFILIDRRASAVPLATYGSLNLNQRSLEINHEVFVANRDPSVFERLDERWHAIVGECREQPAAEPQPDAPAANAGLETH